MNMKKDNSTGDPSAFTSRIKAFHKAKVICIGDVMLDRFVYGDVERVSPEAPVPVLHIKQETAVLGGAGNVLRNLLTYGADVSFFALVGDDVAGSEIRELIRKEGTSNDGNRVLRFNSTFFSVAETEAQGKPVTVQPIAIAYTTLDGLPLGRSRRPLFAWYGEMDLVSHLWSVLGQSIVTVEIAFLPTTTMEACGSRKDMARRCELMVATSVSDMLGGRLT